MVDIGYMVEEPAPSGRNLLAKKRYSTAIAARAEHFLFFFKQEFIVLIEQL